MPRQRRDCPLVQGGGDGGRVRIYIRASGTVWRRAEGCKGPRVAQGLGTQRCRSIAAAGLYV